MNTPVQRIGIGVTEAIRRRDSDRTPKLAALAAVAHENADLVNLRASTLKVCRRLHDMQADEAEKLTKFEVETKAHFKTMGMVDGEREGTKVDMLGAEKRKQMYDAAVSQFKHALIEENTEERLGLHCHEREPGEPLGVGEQGLESRGRGHRAPRLPYQAKAFQRIRGRPFE